MAVCSKCQKELPEGAILCPFCGTPVEEGGTSQATQGYSQPVEQPREDYSVKKTGNGLAVASMVLGIVGAALFLLPVIPIILGVIGLIFGIIGVIGRNKPKKGMAIAGIVTSLVAIIIGGLLVFGVFSAVSSNIERSRESKDLIELDNILSSANVAIANLQAKGKDVIDLGTTSTGVQDSENPDASEKDKIQHSIYSELLCAGKASSKAASGSDIHIYLSYDASKGAAFISVGYSKTAPSPGEMVDGIPCEYTSNTVFAVSTSPSVDFDTKSTDKKDSGKKASEDDDFDLDDLDDILDDDDEDDDDDEKDSSKSNGSSSVRELLDSYEEFVDEYVDFMKKYSKDPVKYVDEYTEYLEKYEDFVKKVDDVKEDDVSSDDWAYYLEVTARVLKKIASIYE